MQISQRRFIFADWAIIIISNQRCWNNRSYQYIRPLTTTRYHSILVIFHFFVCLFVFSILYLLGMARWPLSQSQLPKYLIQWLGQILSHKANRGAEKAFLSCPRASKTRSDLNVICVLIPEIILLSFTLSQTRCFHKNVQAKILYALAETVITECQLLILSTVKEFFAALLRSQRNRPEIRIQREINHANQNSRTKLPRYFIDLRFFRNFISTLNTFNVLQQTFKLHRRTDQYK